MIKLSNEQLAMIKEAVDFQLIVSRATGNPNIVINCELGDMFLSMLEEKTIQERCPYCHEDREGYVSALGAFFLSLDCRDGWLLNAGKSGKIKPRPIKYCPMCGRKLLSIKEELSI